MKSIGVMSTAALFLLFGIAAPANGRQEKPKEEARPAQQQAKPEKQQAAAPKQQQEAKPEKQQQAKAPRQQQAKPEKQQQAAAPKQQKAKPEKQEQAKAPKQEQEAKPEKQQQAKAPKQEQAKPEKQQQQARTQQQRSDSARQQQASSSHAPQRTQQAIARQRAQPALRLSARGSGRIPDDRFRASFGRGHDFHMGNPVLVGGFSRFQYSGFWFGFVQPWPVGWYYTDDVYIDYVDGEYYMYNPYHPGARFAISVVI
jgi:primosomal protein N'